MAKLSGAARISPHPCIAAGCRWARAWHAMASWLKSHRAEDESSDATVAEVDPEDWLSSLPSTWHNVDTPGGNTLDQAVEKAPIAMDGRCAPCAERTAFIVYIVMVHHSTFRYHVTRLPPHHRGQASRHSLRHLGFEPVPGTGVLHQLDDPRRRRHRLPLSHRQHKRGR